MTHDQHDWAFAPRTGRHLAADFIQHHSSLFFCHICDCGKTADTCLRTRTSVCDLLYSRNEILGRDQPNKKNKKQPRTNNQPTTHNPQQEPQEPQPPHSGECLFSATGYLLVRQSMEMLYFDTFPTRRCSLHLLKFDHGVPAVGHGILLYVCPHHRVQLDHGVFSVGHGTFWCSRQSASWCLTVAFLPMVPARIWRTGQVCSQLRAYWCSPMVSSPLFTTGRRSCPNAAYDSTCSSSSSLAFPHGGFEGCDP